MANKYKSASSPGSYRQVIPHDFSKSSKLRTANTKDLQDQQARNILLAQRNRDGLNSLSNQQRAEAASRGTVLDYDTQLRTLQFNSSMQAAKNAQNAAIARSEQLTREGKAADQRLVNIVNQTLELGVDIAEKVDAAALKQEKTTAFSQAIEIGSTAEQNSILRNTTREFFESANETDEYIWSLKQQGYTWNDIKGIVGARPEVFQMLQLQTLKNSIPNIHAQLVAENPQLPGMNITYSEAMRRDPAAARAYYKAEVAKRVGILNEHNINPELLFDTIHRANAAFDSQLAKVSGDFNAVEAERNRHATKLGQYQDALRTNNWEWLNAEIAKYPDLIPQTLLDIQKLVEDRRLTPNEARKILNNLYNPATSIAFSDKNNKYFSQSAEIYRAIDKIESGDWSRTVNASQALAQQVGQEIRFLESGEIPYSVEGHALIEDRIINSDVLTEEHKSRLLNQLTKAVEAWDTDSQAEEYVKNKIYAADRSGYGITYESLARTLGGDEAALTKWENKKRNLLNNNAYRTSRHNEIKNRLWNRSGIGGDKNTRAAENYHDAVRIATEKWDATVELTLNQGGTLAQAYQNADAEFTKDLGDDPFKGDYSIPDRSKDPNAAPGFNKIGMGQSEYVNIEKTNYTQMTGALTDAYGKTGTNGERLKFAINDTEFLNSVGLDSNALQRIGNGNATNADFGKIHYLKEATGMTHMSDFEFAQKLTQAQNVEESRGVDPRYYEMAKLFGNNIARNGADAFSIRGGGGDSSGAINISETNGQTYSVGFTAGEGLGGPSTQGQGEYHLDIKFNMKLPWQQVVEQFDKMAHSYVKDGRVIEFSNQAVAGIQYNPYASYTEKMNLIKKCQSAHTHSTTPGWGSCDFYIPNKGTNRFDTSAENARVYVPSFNGGSIVSKTSYGYGGSVDISNGQEVMIRVGHLNPNTMGGAQQQQTLTEPPVQPAQQSPLEEKQWDLPKWRSMTEGQRYQEVKSARSSSGGERTVQEYVNLAFQAEQIGDLEARDHWMEVAAEKRRLKREKELRGNP